jgi:hypothetical protein
MNIVQWIMVGWLAIFLFGCSSSKKDGEACERDSQCDGLMVCYKESSKDEIGKCMKAAQARALYEKKKEEK